MKGRKGILTVAGESVSLEALVTRALIAANRIQALGIRVAVVCSTSTLIDI